MLITVTNLFPRPDQPTRGMFNFQLFREVSKQLAEGRGQKTEGSGQYLNICLVPEWRVWRWGGIRRWVAPDQLSSCSVVQLLSECANAHSSLPITTQQPNNSSPSRASGATQQPNNLTTLYLPVFYLPFLGRSINWWFYYRALRDHLINVGGALRRGDSGIVSATHGHRRTECASHIEEKSNNQSLTTENAACGVLVPWLYPDGVAVARAIKGRGARLWLMALGTDTFHLKSWLRRRKILEACEQAEGIICVAQVLADRLAAAGVPRAKLHVVPNGVDASLFRVRNNDELLVDSYSLLGSGGGESVKSYGLSVIGGEKKVIGYPLSVISNTNNQEPTTNNCVAEAPNNQSLITNNGPANGGTILFVGNLVPVKAPEVLLRAFAALDEKLSSGQVAKLLREGSPGLSHNNSTTQQLNNLTTHLVVIGEGPERERLGALAGRLGIADRVQFLGRQSREEVALWMNRADVLCLSSRSEGMPNVVLEARASGLPVVTTPAGAIPELPLNKEHFLVVEACTPEALAEGLLEMLSRDLSCRKPDPAIPTWGEMAGEVLELMGAGR